MSEGHAVLAEGRPSFLHARTDEIDLASPILEFPLLYSNHGTTMNTIQEPLLLTGEEVAALLRKTRKAIYVMVARRQLPGVVRISRRVLFRREDLLHWLDQKSAPSLKE